ncbi:hypothetical protein [Clostridium thermarum]|uniref:hypothetical protein n=1 Tax=Clostridium thermarum TaxID=1716543 RepID=UPI001123F0A1|nr:hypothetical protein [Clostridium thermarum]
MADNKEKVKVSFERIENDRKHLLAKIMWQAEGDINDSEVYAELSGKENSLQQLKRINDSNVWCATYKITDCFTENVNLDKNMIIKLVQYKVKPNRLSC